MTDPAKVQAKIARLNLETPGQTWVAVEDYFSLMKTDFQPPVFHMDKGLILKAFHNQITGEIKLFPAIYFEV